MVTWLRGRRRKFHIEVQNTGPLEAGLDGFNNTGFVFVENATFGTTSDGPRLARRPSTDGVEDGISLNPPEPPDGVVAGDGAIKLLRLQMLRRRWLPRSHRGVTVIHGLGGSGKTTLASRFAAAAARSRRQVWWVNAGDPTQLRATLRFVAFGVPAQMDKADQSWFVDQAWEGVGYPARDLLWSLLNQSRSRWLLIFDGADAPENVTTTGSPGAIGGDGCERHRTVGASCW